MSQPFKRLGAIALLAAWCGSMLLVRFHRTDSLAFAFLGWNLVLAIIPVVAAAGLRHLSERPGSILQKAICFMTWLCFLPNAPYLVTDFVHLEQRARVPLWFDVALLASFAGAGVLFAFVSVADVQMALRKVVSPLLATTIAMGSLFLCGFGIYLGRFLRWNSWDVLTSPRELFGEVADRILNPLAHPRTLAVSVIYGLALVLGYTALRTLAPLFDDREQHRQQAS